MTFGNALENAMEQAAARVKKDEMKAASRHQVLAHWLDLDDSMRYKSPSMTKG
jgi:hypothetical protein